MRVLLIALVLAVAALGLNTGSALAQPIGPVCANVVGGTINETVQVFALPSGGANFLISGKNLNGSVPLSGSGFLSGTAFTFVAIGHGSIEAGSLRVFEGIVGTVTGSGSGRCFNTDSASECGTGTNVNYFVVPCP